MAGGNLGDAIRAIGRLRPNDDLTSAMIAEMLGFDWSPRALGPGPTAPVAPPTREVPPLKLRSSLMIPKCKIFAPPVDTVPPREKQGTTVVRRIEATSARNALVAFLLPEHDSEQADAAVFGASDAMAAQFTSLGFYPGSYEIMRDDRSTESLLDAIDSAQVCVFLIPMDHYQESKPFLLAVQRATERQVEGLRVAAVTFEQNSFAYSAIGKAFPIEQIDPHRDVAMQASKIAEDLARGHRPPTPWSTAAALPADQPWREPPLERPLFKPQWTRGILFEAGARKTFSQQVDVPAITRQIVQGKPVKLIPRLSRLSLRHGVQVLIDSGSGMEPFHADQELIVQEFSRLCPPGQMSLRFFSNCPARGCYGPPTWDDEKYVFPPAGTPLLIFTDLGIGSLGIDPAVATPWEWDDFAQRAKCADCPIIAFVPYSKERWPQFACGWMRIATWDSDTTVGVMRRSKRGAR